MQQLAKQFLNVILPPRCIGCRTMVETPGNLCGTCWGEVDFITDPYCTQCGYPLETNAPKNSLCGKCIQDPPPYDKGRSVFCYNQDSRRLITYFKYGDQLQGLGLFTQWLTNISTPWAEQIDAIVPVPLHRIRLFTRRYNQAALLANALSHRLNVPMEPDWLIRQKHNTPQAALTRRQRWKNVKGVFTVPPGNKKKIKDNSILLIDDVMTTGATIRECARVLKRAGAAEVYVATLARTVEGR